MTPFWLLLENCLNELHRSNSRRFALPMIASENGEHPLSKLTAPSLGKFGGGWLTMVHYIIEPELLPVTPPELRSGTRTNLTHIGLPRSERRRA